ncbi:AtzG-like protein [uncultured Marivita sp.]|uniref:AtzG-like protein n=1 Tax=uncultured Marivita sp. TaxID=888080 RepID=UPI0026358F88|nr:AtzG-like protein [uncultured Marivita sp.]
MSVRTFLAAPEGFEAEALVRATAPAIGLRLGEDDVAEIAMNLERSAGFAALLADIPQIDLEEPAPVFRAEPAP